MVNRPNPQTPPHWGSLSAAAERYGCSIKTLRRMVGAGEVSAYRLGKRMLRVDFNEIDALMRRLPASGDAA